MGRRGSITNKKIKIEPMEIIEPDNEEIFEVESIIEKRIISGKVSKAKQKLCKNRIYSVS